MLQEQLVVKVAFWGDVNLQTTTFKPHESFKMLAIDCLVWTIQE